MSEYIHQQLNEQTRDALLAFCLTHVSGHDSTLPVSVADIVYHTRAVARGCRRPLIVADLPFGRGDRVAVLISGLGATPLMEQYILYDSVGELLAEAGIEVAVPLVGNFFTSLEMMGVTLTLLQLDDELEALMKHPCSSIGLKIQGTQP